jgi:hypothetical protein
MRNALNISRKYCSNRRSIAEDNKNNTIMTILCVDNVESYNSEYNNSGILIFSTALP